MVAGSPLFFLLQSFFVLGTNAVPSFALGGVTRNSFICWSRARIGRIVWDHLYLRLPGEVRFKDFVTVFILKAVTHTISQRKMNAF